jgi:hypothetical protein
MIEGVAVTPQRQLQRWRAAVGYSVEPGRRVSHSR